MPAPTAVASSVNGVVNVPTGTTSGDGTSITPTVGDRIVVALPIGDNNGTASGTVTWKAGGGVTGTWKLMKHIAASFGPEADLWYCDITAVTGPGNAHVVITNPTYGFSIVTLTFTNSDPTTPLGNFVQLTATANAVALTPDFSGSEIVLFAVNTFGGSAYTGGNSGTTLINTYNDPGGTTIALGISNTPTVSGVPYSVGFSDAATAGTYLFAMEVVPVRPPGWAYVRRNASVTGAAGTSKVVAITTASTDGNSIIVSVRGGTGASVTSVVDSQGNAYLISRVATSGTVMCFTATAHNAKALSTSDTITVTIGSTTSTPGFAISVDEWSGLFFCGPNTTGVHTGTSTAATATCSTATDSPNEVAIAIVGTRTTAATLTAAGWTQLASVAGATGNMIVLYKDTGSTGATVGGTLTLSTAGGSNATLIQTFRVNDGFTLNPRQVVRSTSATGSCTVTLPRSPVSGNGLFFAVRTANGLTTTPPTGVSLLRTIDDGVHNVIKIFQRTGGVQSGDGTTYVFTISSTNFNIETIELPGVDVTTPIDVAADATGTTGTPGTGPSITPTYTGELVWSLAETNNTGNMAFTANDKAPWGHSVQLANAGSPFSNLYTTMSPKAPPGIAINANWNAQAGSDYYSTTILAFKQAGGFSPTPSTHYGWGLKLV